MANWIILLIVFSGCLQVNMGFFVSRVSNRMAKFQNDHNLEVPASAQVRNANNYERYHLINTAMYMSDEDVDNANANVESENINPEDMAELIESLESALENNSTTNATETVVDPYQVAVIKLEMELQEKVSNLQEMVRRERVAEGKLRDKISESGKMGFYMIQAQVTDFQKKREREQKALVLENKRNFVDRIIPLVDELRTVPLKAEPQTEREIKMHSNFGSLLSSILLILEKSGYKEFNADPGSKLDPAKHKVVQAVHGPESGIIIEQTRPGIIFNGEEVIRHALVVASDANVAVESENEEISIQ